MSEVKVRAATPDDAAGVVTVLNPIITAGDYTAFATPLTMQQEAKYIASLPARAIFHVAERTRDRAIVGFQSMEPFASYTHALDHVGVPGTYVDLACRRQGIARALFRATFAAARDLGYDKMLTYIRADNQPAVATYLSQGFRVVGTAARQVRLADRYIDALIVECLL